MPSMEAVLDQLEKLANRVPPGPPRKARKPRNQRKHLRLVTRTARKQNR